MPEQNDEEKTQMLGRALQLRRDTRARLNGLDATRLSMAQPLHVLAKLILEGGECSIEYDETISSLVFICYEEGKCEPTRVSCPSEKEIKEYLTERDHLRARMEQVEKILKDYL